MPKITNIITYETNAYSSFKKINGNRDINLNNVKNIIDNIKKNGLKPTIIIVNEKMEIIDGQHRIEALKQLNLPVMYQIHKGLTLEDCIALNTSGKKWTLADYVISYATNGNQEYQELCRLGCKYGKEFTMNNIVSIVNSKSMSNSGDAIKKGRLVLKYKGADAEKKLETISTYMEFFTHVVGRKEILINLLSKLIAFDAIDQARLEEQIKKYAHIVTTAVNHDEVLNKLEELYNYKRTVKNRFVSRFHEVYDDNRG